MLGCVVTGLIRVFRLLPCLGSFGLWMLVYCWFGIDYLCFSLVTIFAQFIITLDSIVYGLFDGIYC